MELWSAFLVFFLPASRLVILETNKEKKWEIRDVFNLLCDNYT